MSVLKGDTVEVSSDHLDDICIHNRDSRQVVWMNREDALQVAYALQSVCSGQGPSLIRIKGGKRKRVD
jgi:hypothetical protein